MLINFRRHFKGYLLGGLILATIFVWWVIFNETRGDRLKISFLDVGQGDAIFIEAPNGNQVLIDAGPNKTVLRHLSQVMPFYDRSIDLLIATHPDRDHIGGLPFILERFRIGGYLESGNQSDTVAYKLLIKKITDQNLTPIIARRGMRVILTDGVFLDILFPDRDASGLDANDASVVAMLNYGRTKILLTGDAPKKIEEYLVYLEGKNLAATVLKVGHHGSKTSTAVSFLNEVQPTMAIIQAGADNPYGHPHKEVTELLASIGAKILTTGQVGTITLISNGRTIVVKK